MKRLLKNNGLEIIVRWILGAIFVYASWHKIAAPSHFAKIIYGYYLFPDFTINLTAIILPFLELFAGTALIFGIYPRSAALIVNTLLLAFIIAISINVIRGHEFDCGCFSFGKTDYTASAIELLFRDIIGFVLGLHLLLFEGKRKWCIKQSGGIFSFTRNKSIY